MCRCSWPFWVCCEVGISEEGRQVLYLFFLEKVPVENRYFGGADVLFVLACYSSSSSTDCRFRFLAFDLRRGWGLGGRMLLLALALLNVAFHSSGVGASV